MLRPDDRSLLVDLLTPPDASMHLVHAVATTFTLDLHTLVQVPLALAGADLTRASDPLAVLQALGRCQDKVDVFCQAGKTAVPRQPSSLLAYTEPMIHQVAAPRPGHLFHPKLWVLRFADDAGHEAFRLLCGSRNLTGDAAWDCVVVLDGEKVRRRQTRNAPLMTFLSQLPDRVPGGMLKERRPAFQSLVEGLSHIEWQRPDGAISGEDWLTFHVFGGKTHAKPDMSGYRRLIVSPFLTGEGLETVWPQGNGEAIIVTRSDQLEAVTAAPRQWLTTSADVRVLSESAIADAVAPADLPLGEANTTPPSPATASPAGDGGDDAAEAGRRVSLHGLHAKLYCVERAHRAHLLIGSANATGAAWRGNDELLVEIVGSVKTFGVEALAGSAGFGALLEPYVLADSPTSEPDDDLSWQLDVALQAIAEVPLAVHVDRTSDTTSLHVTSTGRWLLPDALADSVTISARPLTLPGRGSRQEAGHEVDCSWQLDDANQITRFIVVQLTADNQRGTASCIIVGQLTGDDPDRLDRILAEQLGTPEAFIRFMLLLLQLAGQDLGSGPLGELGASAGTGRWTMDGSGLLESLVEALALQPESIASIDRIVGRLAATVEGQAVLPHGWAEIWPAVMSAYGQLARQPGRSA